MTEAYTEPVLGWRLWHVRDGRLSSWICGADWPAGERLEARCRRCAAPGAGHRCGIYALRSREAAQALLDEVPRFAGAVALGRVSLWGRVFENIGGWRGQYAYPYALEVVRGGDRVAGELRRRYLVDVA